MFYVFARTDLLEELSYLQGIVEQFNQRLSQLETRVTGSESDDSIANTNTNTNTNTSTNTNINTNAKSEDEFVLTKARSAEAFSPPPKATWISSIALPINKNPEPVAAAPSQDTSSQTPPTQPLHQKAQVSQSTSPHQEKELLSPRAPILASG